jgi:two-component system, NtrC family, response regulator HydG
VKPEGVLIADDDPDFVASIRELLEDYGYVVHVASDGSEALDYIRTHSIDVLILDLRMPMLCGLEVYVRLKEEGRCLPTIIVTAYAREMDDDIQQLRAMHVTGVLTKPFDPAELLHQLAAIKPRTI